MTTILNFSHPIAQTELKKIGDEVEMKQITVDINMEQDFAEQVVAIVDAVDWTPEQWQTQPFIVNFAGLSSVAVLLSAEIHGRCGHFPKMLQMKRTPNGFEIGKIEDLQRVRDNARRRRF
jgi:hypothetical protein